MEHLSRRRLLQGSLALAGLSLAPGCSVTPPWAQQPKAIPKIGFYSPLAPAPFHEEFRQGLAELGYQEGRTIEVQYRFADGDVLRGRPMATELVALGPAVIVVEGNGAARAFGNTTSTIPIVMVTTADPVADGLVASLAHPG